MKNDKQAKQKRYTANSLRGSAVHNKREERSFGIT